MFASHMVSTVDSADSGSELILLPVALKMVVEESRNNGFEYLNG
jgi:hypothetical protein